MLNLAFRSVLVLGILWGMVFAIGVAVLYSSGIEGPAAVGIGVLIALAIGGGQYLISPFIIQWIYKINWVPMDAVDPQMAEAVREVCRRRGINEPRFGIIEDGNPNAFTFGHYPGNARVVITRGLVDICDPEERKAVMLHEMGHVVHWDFVVMTIAATVPLVLYMIYRFGIMASAGRNRSGGYMIAVAVAAFVFYIISQYIVLFLSRVREYYADHFAAVASHNPNALSTALVKIAYGLARAQKEVAQEGEEQTVSAQAIAASGGLKSMGIFDPGFGASLALAAAGTSTRVDQACEAECTVKAMRWDIFNPWALVCEISSSHPLPAKRIRALGKISEQMGQRPAYDIPEESRESYWGDFFADIAIQFLPVIGLMVGVGVALGLGLSAGAEGTAQGLFLAPLGAAVGGLALGMFLRVVLVYPKRGFPDQKVADLVSQVRVSKVRSIPSTLRGFVIGRGIPGLYWSEDLVVQDDSGFMVCDYRQPIRFLEVLFGLFRAESFVGQPVTVTGWYRRFPRPYLEMWQVRLPNGQVHTCHNWAVSFYGSLLLLAAGTGMFLFGLILQMGA